MRKQWSWLYIPPIVSVVVLGVFTVGCVIIAILYLFKGMVTISLICWVVVVLTFLSFLWVLYSYRVLRSKQQFHSDG
jgi:hypothetical protein